MSSVFEVVPPVFRFEADSVIQSIMERTREKLFGFPPVGTKVTDITDQQKLAIAVANGVPYETVMEGRTLVLRSLVPFSIADDGKGGYILAVKGSIRK